MVFDRGSSGRFSKNKVLRNNPPLAFAFKRTFFTPIQIVCIFSYMPLILKELEKCKRTIQELPIQAFFHDSGLFFLIPETLLYILYLW
jgi:hypothetical protein